MPIKRKDYLKPFEERRKRIRKMLAAEMTFTEIGKALGVSSQAIRRIVGRMEGKTNA